MTSILVRDREIRIQGRFVRIARLEADLYHFLDDPEDLLRGLRECGARIDLFTFMQKLPEREPKFPYPMEWDNLAAIPITSFDHWKAQQITSEARNRVRQAEKKGIVLREVKFSDELVKGIWDIYNETPIRQGRPFPHYGKPLRDVHEEEATFLDHSFFVGAFLKGDLIGFIKATANETWTQANLMNILSMVRHRDKAPTNALIAEAVRSCAQRGIAYLCYQRFSYGNKAPDGIAKFKQVNGFQKYELPRYYVPLTALGDAAFRFGLHRRMVDRLPQHWVSRVRELRRRWHGA